MPMSITLSVQLARFLGDQRQNYSKEQVFINPLSAKSLSLNVHPLKVVYRYRDQQLHVFVGNYSYLFNLRLNNYVQIVMIKLFFVPNKKRSNSLIGL